MILDTNALSATAGREPGALQELTRADRVDIPAIVPGEYRFGIAQSRRRAEYEHWLAGMVSDSRVMTIDADAAGHYIAALRRQHAAPLLSRDRHFDFVRDLKRIAW